MRHVQVIAAVMLAGIIAACDGSDRTDETQTPQVAAETEQPTISEPEVAMPKVEDGVQIVRVRVEDTGYTPASIQLQPGIPARIIFDQHGKYECSSQIQAPDFGVKVTDLPQGEETIVEFTPEKEGEYTFMCGMDMLKGKIIVRKS